MTALANSKHEKFAQELFKGKTATEAYANAGYKPDDGNATRLTGNDRIKARIAELQSASALRVEVTVASLIQEAAEIQQEAKKAGQFSAATAALTAKAKLAGLWIDKAENLNRNIDANSLSDADLAAVIAGDGSEDPAKTSVGAGKLN